jgi:hypothetical protein
VRSSAAVALSVLGSVESVPGILNARDHSPGAECPCEEMLVALSRMGRREILPLLRSLLGERDATHRKVAAIALGCLRDLESMPRLVQLLSDPEARVREEAAGALGTLGSGEAVEPLVTLMGQGGPGSWRAARALAEIGARERSRSLLALLASEDSDIRGAAASALTELGSPAGIPVLLEGQTDLTVLNSRRDKDRWTSASRHRLRLPPVGYTSESLLGALAKETGVAVELPEDASALWTLERVQWLDGDHPQEVSVREILLSLDRNDLGAILEPLRIRIVSKAEGYLFWKAWWEAEQKKR